MLRSYIVEGQPLHVGGVIATPRSRVVKLDIAGQAGFAWQMPVSVDVNGQRHRIVDVTRVVEIALLLIAFLKFTRRSR